MYIKKETRKLINNLNSYVDDYVNSKGFKQFIESKKIYVGLKENSSYRCTKCNKLFNCNKKINEKEICPNCQQELILKRTRNYQEKDYFIYLIKHEDNFVIRNYELYSYCSYGNTMSHILTEYGRQEMYEDGSLGLTIMINNMRRNTGGYWYINYFEETKFWKEERYLSTYGSIYVDDDTLGANYWNSKELLDNAEVNICDIVNGIYHNNYNLELLVKAKLYNLASHYYEFKNKTFEDNFGVDRSYLEFMRLNNITYDELETLKVLKIKDFELIKYFNQMPYFIEELLEYCKPYDLYNYKIISKDCYLYRDYLRMAKKLKLDLKDKKILYPKKLKEEHDKLQNQIETIKNKKITKMILKRFKQINKYTYQDKKYIIFPVKTVDELIEESNQQNNCVKTYAENVADGICDIYFMRLLSDQEHSLVTVEVKNSKVVQKRTKFNEITTKEQDKFLKLWETKILKAKKG